MKKSIITSLKNSPLFHNAKKILRIGIAAALLASSLPAGLFSFTQDVFGGTLPSGYVKVFSVNDSTPASFSAVSIAAQSFTANFSGYIGAIGIARYESDTTANKSMTLVGLTANGTPNSTDVRAVFTASYNASGDNWFVGVISPAYYVTNGTALAVTWNGSANGGYPATLPGGGFVFRSSDNVSWVFDSAGHADLEIFTVTTQIAVSTNYALPMFSPVALVGSINASSWAGNVTDYGFYVGSAPGVFDYTQTQPLFTHDPYGMANATGPYGGIIPIRQYLYNTVNGTVYYYQAWVLGQDNAGAYYYFFGDTLNFTAISTTYSSSLTVQTGNLTQITDAATTLPAVIVSGSFVAGQYPVNSWGSLVGTSSSAVSAFGLGATQFSHTGTNSGIGVFQDTYDVTSGNATIFARAYAVDSHGGIVFGDIVSTIPTLAADPTISLGAPIIIGNIVTLSASLSQPTFTAAYGFSYGTHSNADNWIMNLVPNAGIIYGATSPAYTLLPSTTYYYNFQILINANSHSVYSAIGNFTTGVQTTGTLSAPTVITYLWSDVESTSFNTSLYIAGNNLTSAGIQIKLPADTFWTVGQSFAVNSTGTYNITVNGLLPNTVYLYRAYGTNTASQVGVGVTVQIQTLMASANFPTSVSAGQAYAINDVGFKVLVTVLGSNLTAVGLQYRQVTQPAWSDAGNISINDTGSYELTVSGLIASTAYYFRGYAMGLNYTVDPAPGSVQTLAPGASTINPNGPPPAPLPGTPGSFNFRDSMTGFMKSLGMDNISGHWAFMAILVLIDAIIFGIAAIYFFVKGEKLVARILMGLAAVVALAILGTFIFSGLLSMWAVVVLIFGIIGLIFMLVAPVLNGGRGASGG